MSLLIKGMEMPKKCTECLMREPLSDYCELLLRYLDREELNGRDADCPLVELPEKHGRLVDVDEISATMLDRLDQTTFEYALSTAPTIVESEGD